MTGKLIFKNGEAFEGISFGADTGSAGEVVFSTGMMGYPESLTDPSYKGQILILTYPLIGNYGIPEKSFWESSKIQVSGLIVSDYIDTPYHFQSKQTLGSWLLSENIPGLIIKDTRLLTIKLREKGVVLGKIEFGKKINFFDPNSENLVEKVSIDKIYLQNINKNANSILLIDCGAKNNIKKALIKREVNVITVPWDFDLTSQSDIKNIDAVVISNGPGDPTKVKKTIENIRKLLKTKIPVLGICLGHQLLALSAGGSTKKLKYGHRSQNQPCILYKNGKATGRCFITTQNHGFAVDKIPPNFFPWFINANDKSIEGIIHKKMPVMSVQFHPEATPGPEDTEWIFDYFLNKL
jgi:carbamoyl-phosphate synthase small subunit